MLDSETKSRIDSARDILVGKVPDPKSQVEQITIALIYKFMDDMDRQSEELGGKATFFSQDYKKYSWPILMDPRLGGHERLIRYAEGIEKMNQNKNLPQLFRDIFRGAYLPYRDPETLNLFLKEINSFTYDNSEQLGDAYEYLTSIMNSQGEAGQFRTPRHIIDFIVAVLDPRKNETILDPACGTAGFLISSFKHILAANTKVRPGDLLKVEEREKLMTNFCGYDISPDYIRLARANMYLHGFANPRLHEYDTLTSEERWDERFDVILANPPFFSPKGGVRPHNRFSIKANRTEVLFVDYIAEHLNVNGRAGIIVPEGIIFQSQNAYKALRKMLIENYLWAVVSLPAGCFNPYSGVKTSILFLDKSLAKNTDEILFVKIEGDGFGLGAQRRPNGKDDLPEALRDIADFKLRIVDLKKSASDNHQSTISNIQSVAAFSVKKSRILESVDINLSGNRYRIAIDYTNAKWPMVELGEVLDYEQPTNYIVQSVDYNDKYPTPVLTAGKSFILGYTNEKEGIFHDGLPVIIFDDFTTATKFVDFPFKVKSSAMKILRAKKEKANPRYLFYAIQKIEFTPGEHKRYWISQYSKFQIPLPPLEIQKKIVAELNGYQKVIDGAKQVIANFKPTIRIDQEWPMTALGDACERIMDGTHFSPKNSPIGDYMYVTAKNIKEMALDLNDITYITQDEHKSIYQRCPVKNGDVLYIKDGATTGVACINELDREFSLLSSVAVLRGKPNMLENRFLAYYLNSIEGKAHMLSMVAGVAITRLTLTKLNAAIIPLPPLDVQREIVAELEVERELVESNRKLVMIFEKKIQSKLAEIWGEKTEIK